MKYLWEKLMLIFSQKSSLSGQRHIVELVKDMLVGCTSRVLVSWIAGWDSWTWFISFIWSNWCPSGRLVANVVHCASKNSSLMLLRYSIFVRGARICESHRADLLKESVLVFVYNRLNTSTSSWVSYDAYLREPWVFDVLVPDKSGMVSHITSEVIWFYIWVHHEYRYTKISANVNKGKHRAHLKVLCGHTPCPKSSSYRSCTLD